MKYYFKIDNISGIKDFFFNGKKYGRGDAFHSDDPCEILNFYKAYRAANPDLGTREDEVGLIKKLRKKCQATIYVKDITNNIGNVLADALSEAENKSTPTVGKSPKTSKRKKKVSATKQRTRKPSAIVGKTPPNPRKYDKQFREKMRQGGNVYRTKKGDSFKRIERDYQMPPDSLRRLNPEVKSTNLPEGYPLTTPPMIIAGAPLAVGAIQGIGGIGGVIIVGGIGIIIVGIGIMLAYAIERALDKLDDYIERLEDELRGKKAIQYALKATSSGRYHCIAPTCSPYEKENGIYLNAGDVWKYGKTLQIKAREFGKYGVIIDKVYRYYQTGKRGLDMGMAGGPLRLEAEFYGINTEVLLREKQQLVKYYLEHGDSLPPGNRRFF